MGQEIIKNANQLAFPASESQIYGGLSQPGLTKREYFVAMAMQGLMASEVDEISSAVSSAGGQAVMKTMARPTYHCDDAGFWTWRAGAVLSDQCFPSEKAAETDYKVWAGVYDIVSKAIDWKV